MSVTALQAVRGFGGVMGRHTNTHLTYKLSGFGRTPSHATYRFIQDEVHACAMNVQDV